MADTISKEHRSWNMSQIRSVSKLEQAVRSALWRDGFRFRKNDKRLPGKPDIVLPKYKTVIEVNGCFWHRHEGCRFTRMPKSNQEFWQEKFDRNVSNDKKNRKALEDLGWKVIIVWECELKDDFAGVIDRLEKEIRKNSG